MDIDGAAGDSNPTTTNIRVVINPAIDNGSVDPEQVDDGAAATINLRVAIDVEVQVRGVFGVQSNRASSVSLWIEHVAVPGHASIGDVDVERGIIARECLNARCFEIQE